MEPLTDLIEAAVVRFYSSCARQCGRFPVTCYAAYVLAFVGHHQDLPLLGEDPAAVGPSLLRYLGCLLPIIAVLGAVATGEFCDWARAKVDSLAKTLDYRAGISVDWRLHPPELADAYEEWCLRQPYLRVIPWLSVGMYLQLCLRQHSTSAVSCATNQAFHAVMCTILLLKALLHRRLSSSGHTVMQAAAVVLRASMAAALSLQRDHCFLSLAGGFFTSRTSLIMATIISLPPFCALYPVVMEDTFSIFSLAVAVHFLVLCLRYHVTKFPALALADVDFWAVVGCLTVTILEGQVALIIRYWVGISNMQCFLRACPAMHLHHQPARLHPN